MYRARQSAFDRDVAVKVMSVADDQTTRERFAVECSAIGALSGHPNIVTVYETGTTDDRRPFIVMEFLPGGSLGDRLATEGPLDWPQVVAIGVKLSGALESAHRAGVLHRDVKPENVLLSRFGDAKLADFGMARARFADDAAAAPVATLAHAAPEVVAGHPATPAADIYSLASTLHTLLSGRAPFVVAEGASWVRVATAIAEDPPPDLRPLGVGDQLCTVLEGAMAKEAADRPADAAQFGRQLQAVEAGNDVAITPLPIEVDAPVASVVPAAEHRSRARSFARAHRKALGLLLTGLVLVVTAVAALMRLGGGGTTVGLAAIYRDNFDAGEGWYEHSDEVATLGYDTGQYRISVDQPRQQAISDSSFRGSSDGTTYTHLGDVSVQVSAASPSMSGLFGVTCRQSPQAASYYEGLVGADGTVLIAKFADNRLLTLARGTVAPPDPAAVTRVRLDCTGDHGATRLRLFVGDRQVIEAGDHDSLGPGSFGMTVDTGTADRADATFDDLVVFGHRDDLL